MNSQHYAENIAQLINNQSRTKFPIRGTTKMMTMNKGKLYPVYNYEILPGDTWQVHINSLIRSTTMIKPIMNNLWIQIQCFFVPNRLVDPHWEEIMGANKQGPWITNKTTYTVPKLKAPQGGWDSKSLADYLGVPIKIENLEINSYYTKSYVKIWCDRYRDENRQNLSHITEEGDLQGSNGTNYVTDAELGGCLLPVGKRHDYFTSSMIEPQKGPDVLLPLGSSAPVIGNGNALGLDVYTALNNLQNTYLINRSDGYGLAMSSDSQTDKTLNQAKTPIGYSNTNKFVGLSENPAISGAIADLSQASAASVNQLRMAIALQQLYELDALSGTRYTEIIFSHYGVRSSDSRLQISEYLGGKSIPLSVTQVIQTSETASGSPQGNLAGMSQTWDGDEYFTKSFEEHGIMHVLACIKGENIYQQGLHAKFSKFKRTDYYDPIFANLGMQPIYNREIYAQGTEEDNEAFGYKEAWDEYRVFNAEVAGEFRSNAPNSLDYWGIARDFAELPTNGEKFIEEGASNLDKALTVASTVADQFQCVFSMDGSTMVRVMPAHSVPGLKRF